MNILTGEPIFHTTYSGGSTGVCTLAELAQRADEIVALDEEPLVRLAVVEMLAVIVVEALQHTGAIPAELQASDALIARRKVWKIPHSSLSSAVDAYIQDIDTTWFDLFSPNGLGQVEGSAPAKQLDPGKFTSLNPTFGIENSTTQRATPPVVAKSIICLRYLGRGGVNTMPVGGKVTYPLAGPLLQTRAAYVEGSTLRDTILGIITTELVVDTSLPSWRSPAPDIAGDNSGTLITGPRRAMTEVTRIPYLEWGEDGTLVAATTFPGISLTKENIQKYCPTSKMVDRVDAKTKEPKITSPIPLYGQSNPFPWQGLTAVIEADGDDSNRAVESAAAYRSSTALGGNIRVRSINLTHSKQSKISSITEDVFDVPLFLMRESVPDGATRSIIRSRAKVVSLYVARTSSVASKMCTVIRDIEKGNKKKASGKSEDIKLEFLSRVDELFRAWLSKLPALPERGEDDSAMTDHVEKWRRAVVRLVRDIMDDYLKDIPAAWWSSREIPKRRAELNKYVSVTLGIEQNSRDKVGK